ncbi:MAG TPA: ribosomal-processing cysteine protease Prp [Bacillota bacterium]|nr:ribosomal-processing cysteine protease Prp [Bacillota bacterium]HOA15891.1 ribosomal-processing cysteine protease Prp [Bacillota bacterium]HOG53611.1 ribosomal-processing cysteine protease Prp [Bacillota bacterium]
MIEIWVRKDGGKTKGYRVEGHAGWAESGKDIVCAAVSALAIGAENGLSEVAGAVQEASGEGGFLEVTLKPELDERARIQAEAIVDSMVLALARISERYPGRILIHK